MATSPHLRRPGIPSPDIGTASLLESLPPTMLDEILSRLPIRDAARTSVLSRAWCRRWKSVPYKVLDWPIGTTALTIDDVLEHRTFHVLRWPSEIHDVLAHRPSCPVREFRHPHVPEQDFRLSDLWLVRLADANVGVQSLSLKFQWSEAAIINEGVITFPEIHTLHSTIFCCHQLVVLDLEGCDMPRRPPRFGGFPKLTTLSLSHVGFRLGVRELEALISSSSSLRTLRLQNLRIRNEHQPWVIHAPNLRRLLLSSKFDYGWQINDLPAIEEADISWKYYPDDRDFVGLISVFDKATRIKLCTPCSMENVMEGLSRSFVNLKSLSLHIPYCYRNNILSILYLVRNAPKLEVLDIEHDDYPRVQGRVDINSLNVPWADDLFSSLASVNMKNVIWNPYEMLFMEFVLSKARKLEVLSIHQSRQRSKSAEDSKSDEDALGEVSGYTRASPGANVVISRMP